MTDMYIPIHVLVHVSKNQVLFIPVSILDKSKNSPLNSRQGGVIPMNMGLFNMPIQDLCLFLVVVESLCHIT